MQPSTEIIGFIGIGHLAEFMIRGLRRGGFSGQILITPRAQSRAQTLIAECDCELADADAIVERCQLINLAVRPTQAEAALTALRFNQQHIVISYLAGVSLEQLRHFIKVDATVIRAMPISAAAVCASPTMLFPANKLVESWLQHCGHPIVLKQESDFKAASIIGCVYASFLELYASLVDDLGNQGLDAESSRRIIYGVLGGAVDMAAFDTSINAHDLANEVAVDGTYSKICLDALKQNTAFKPWSNAIQLLNTKLSS